MMINYVKKCSMPHTLTMSHAPYFDDEPPYFDDEPSRVIEMVGVARLELATFTMST